MTTAIIMFVLGAVAGFFAGIKLASLAFQKFCDDKIAAARREQDRIFNGGKK